MRRKIVRGILCRTAVIAALVFASAMISIQAHADPVAPTISIINSGSTNFSGYKIDIMPDGSAIYDNGGNEIRRGALPLELTHRLFTEVGAVAPFTAVAAQHCMKSVSFGTTTSLEYKDNRLRDISCPGNPQIAALYATIMDVQKVLGVSPLPRHRLFMQGFKPLQSSGGN